jgi:hypothetical protein
LQLQSQTNASSLNAIQRQESSKNQLFVHHQNLASLDAVTLQEDVSTNQSNAQLENMEQPTNAAKQPTNVNSSFQTVMIMMHAPSTTLLNIKDVSTLLSANVLINAQLSLAKMENVNSLQNVAMTEMHAHLTNVISKPETANTLQLHVHAKLDTLELAMLSLQNVKSENHVTAQLTVMTTTLILLTLAFLERDASTPSHPVMETHTETHTESDLNLSEKKIENF